MSAIIPYSTVKAAKREREREGPVKGGEILVDFESQGPLRCDPNSSFRVLGFAFTAGLCLVDPVHKPVQPCERGFEGFFNRGRKGKKYPVLRFGGFQQFEKSQFSWPVFSSAESQIFQYIFFGNYFFTSSSSSSSLLLLLLKDFEYIFNSL